MSELETLKAEAEALAKRIEEIEAKEQGRGTTGVTYPYRDKFYSHSGKDVEHSDYAYLGFDRDSDAWDNYRRAGYETTFDVLVYQDGTVMATSVNGVALLNPVQL